MSALTVYKCDGTDCQARTESYAGTEGWVTLTGTISRARGVYDGGSWKSDYYNAGSQSHFCSMECLIDTLDAQAQRNAEATRLAREKAEKEAREAQEKAEKDAAFQRALKPDVKAPVEPPLEALDFL